MGDCPQCEEHEMSQAELAVRALAESTDPNVRECVKADARALVAEWDRRAAARHEGTRHE